MVENARPVDRLVVAAAEEAMGEPLVASAFFRPRVNLPPDVRGSALGAVIWVLWAPVWVYRRGRALRLPHPVSLTLSETTLYFVAVRFGGAVTARLQYKSPRSAVAARATASLSVTDANPVACDFAWIAFMSVSTSVPKLISTGSASEAFGEAVFFLLILEAGAISILYQMQ